MNHNEAKEFAEKHIGKENVLEARLTGSYHICGPNSAYNDIDIVCLVKDWDAADETLEEAHWFVGGSCDDREQFRSYKKAGPLAGHIPGRMVPINLIVTQSPTWWMRFCAATELAKEFNLTDKKDRIALFSAVVDREEEDEKEPAPTFTNNWFKAAVRKTNWPPTTPF